ncbi:MAG: hypothetical protein K2Y18_02855 [Alphaproteobacteria bacterium]|nr:hypothetical protein [Alphaproteobacteria bacterium]
MTNFFRKLCTVLIGLSFTTSLTYAMEEVTDGPFPEETNNSNHKNEADKEENGTPPLNLDVVHRMQDIHKRMKDHKRAIKEQYYREFLAPKFPNLLPHHFKVKQLHLEGLSKLLEILKPKRVLRRERIVLKFAEAGDSPTKHAVSLKGTLIFFDLEGCLTCMSPTDEVLAQMRALDHTNYNDPETIIRLADIKDADMQARIRGCLRNYEDPETIIELAGVKDKKTKAKIRDYYKCKHDHRYNEDLFNTSLDKYMNIDTATVDCEEDFFFGMPMEISKNTVIKQDPHLSRFLYHGYTREDFEEVSQIIARILPKGEDTLFVRKIVDRIKNSWGLFSYEGLEDSNDMYKEAAANLGLSLKDFLKSRHPKNLPSTFRPIEDGIEYQIRKLKDLGATLYVYSSLPYNDAIDPLLARLGFGDTKESRRDLYRNSKPIHIWNTFATNKSLFERVVVVDNRISNVFLSLNALRLAKLETQKIVGITNEYYLMNPALLEHQYKLVQAWRQRNTVVEPIRKNVWGKPYDARDEQLKLKGYKRSANLLKKSQGPVPCESSSPCDRPLGIVRSPQ